jgi:hypothetical protein
MGFITRDEQVKEWIDECANELYHLALEMREQHKAEKS